ncbi:MAG: lytic transglycosylase domain-containing protein [Clostridia bacterium]|nr:lytic transglycosylase domain-containing protein [Clostridia bacterium]
MNRLIKTIIGLILCFAVVFSAIHIAKAVYPKDYEIYVLKYSKEFNVSEDLIYAIIKTESNFNSGAKSAKDAFGLMQIIEPTGEWIAETLGFDDFYKEMLFDPETNIKMGTYYISYLLKMYENDEKCALCAYNAGYKKVDSWLLNEKYSKDEKKLNVVPYPETEKYVNQVLNNKKIYAYLYRK